MGSNISIWDKYFLSLGLFSEDKVNRSIIYEQVGPYYSYLINYTRRLKCLLSFLWEFYAMNEENVSPNLLIGLRLYYKIQRLA